LNPIVKTKLKRLSQMSLRNKILLIFLLLIAIPLSLQGMITYSDYSSSLERRTADYSVQIAGQINRNLDRTLMDMQRLSLNPLYDLRLLAILEKYSKPEYANARPSVEEMEKMLLYISGATYNRPEIKGIQIIANNGIIFSNVDSTLIKFNMDVSGEDWYKRIREADGAWVTIPQHVPNYYLERDARQPYFSVARLLREPNGNRALGLIKIDLKLDVFQNILSNVKSEEKGSLFVLNDRNELFFEESSEALQPNVREALRDTSLPNQTEAKHRNIAGMEFLTIVDHSDYSGLKVISFIPVQSLLKETKALRNFTIGIALVCLGVAAVLATYFSYRLSRPLLRLRKKMQLVEQGHFNQSVPVESQDEIGQLSRGFNRMAEEINHLVNEVYAIGLREKEAELAALQSRINPHFIYNTLESINMLAVGRQNYDVSDMVSALGRLLRYTVDKVDRLVPLKEELESVLSYVQIQKLRYGERLNVVFDVDDTLRHYLVPKLILQPLVENAIFHGIFDREEGGTIWIAIARFEEDLLLTVRDDGKGMSEQELERLRASLDVAVQVSLKTSGEDRGLALRNIHQRLKLMFGPGYELHVDGSVGQGTAFTVTIPVTERKEQEADV